MSSRIASLFERVRAATREQGVSSGIRVIRDWTAGNAGYYFYKTFRSPRRFTFQGRSYRYFCHKYNQTWTNERAVEIPIVLEMMRRCDERRILEVGNVLSNYFAARHDVLDKYDPADHVIPHDVVDYRPARPYDLIVTISTLEHVGWDETPRDPTKILHALENLRDCLAPGGKIVATLPLGYTPPLDDLLAREQLPFTHCHYLKRISKSNRWIEAEWKDVEGTRYNEPFYSANALAIGFLEKR